MAAHEAAVDAVLPAPDAAPLQRQRPPAGDRIAVAAVLGTAGEVLLPVLLVLGLGGRVAALGLSAVNVVAVLSVPEMPEPAFMLHVFWGSLLAGLVLWGPGRWSVDGSGPASARVQD